MKTFERRALKDLSNKRALSSGASAPWKGKMSDSDGESPSVQRAPKIGVHIENDVRPPSDAQAMTSRLQYSPKPSSRVKVSFFSDPTSGSDSEGPESAGGVPNKYFSTPVNVKGKAKKKLSPVMEMDVESSAVKGGGNAGQACPMEVAHSSRQGCDAVSGRSPPRTPLYRTSFAVECQRIVKQIMGSEKEDRKSPGKRKAEELDVSAIDAEPPPYDTTPFKSMLAWEVSDMLSSVENSPVNDGTSLFGESLLDLERTDMQLQDFSLSDFGHKNGKGQPANDPVLEGISAFSPKKDGECCRKRQKLTPPSSKADELPCESLKASKSASGTMNTSLMEELVGSNVTRDLEYDGAEDIALPCVGTTQDIGETANATQEIESASREFQMLNTTEVMESPGTVCDLTQEIASVTKDNGRVNADLEIKAASQTFTNRTQHTLSFLGEIDEAASNTWVLEEEPPSPVAGVESMVASLNAGDSPANITQGVVPQTVNVTQEIVSNQEGCVTNITQEIVSSHEGCVADITQELVSSQEGCVTDIPQEMVSSQEGCVADATQEIVSSHEGCVTDIPQETVSSQEGCVTNIPQEMVSSQEGCVTDATQEIVSSHEGCVADITQEIVSSQEGCVTDITQTVSSQEGCVTNIPQEILSNQEGCLTNIAQEIVSSQEAFINTTREMVSNQDGCIPNTTQDIILNLEGCIPNTTQEIISNQGVCVANTTHEIVSNQDACVPDKTQKMVSNHNVFVPNTTQELVSNKGCVAIATQEMVSNHEGCVPNTTQEMVSNHEGCITVATQEMVSNHEGCVTNSTQNLVFNHEGCVPNTTQEMVSNHEGCVPNTTQEMVSNHEGSVPNTTQEMVSNHEGCVTVATQEMVSNHEGCVTNSTQNLVLNLEGCVTDSTLETVLNHEGCVANATQEMVSNHEGCVTNATQEMVSNHEGCVPNTTQEMVSNHEGCVTNATQEMVSNHEGCISNSTQNLALTQESCVANTNVIPEPSPVTTGEILSIHESSRSVNTTQANRPTSNDSANRTQGEGKDQETGNATVHGTSAEASSPARRTMEVCDGATEDVGFSQGGHVAQNEIFDIESKASSPGMPGIVLKDLSGISGVFSTMGNGAGSAMNSAEGFKDITPPKVAPTSVPTCDLNEGGNFPGSSKGSRNIFGPSEDLIVTNKSDAINICHGEDHIAVSDGTHTSHRPENEVMITNEAEDLIGTHAGDQMPVSDGTHADRGALVGTSTQSRPDGPENSGNNEGSDNGSSCPFLNEVPPSKGRFLASESFSMIQEEENVQDVSVFSVGSLSFVTSTPVPGYNNFLFQKAEPPNPTPSLGCAMAPPHKDPTDCAAPQSKLLAPRNEGHKPQNKGVQGTAPYSQTTGIPAARRALSLCQNPTGQTKEPMTSKIPPRGIPVRGSIRPPLARSGLPRPNGGNTKQNVEEKSGIMAPSRLVGSGLKTLKGAAAKPRSGALQSKLPGAPTHPPSQLCTPSSGGWARQNVTTFLQDPTPDVSPAPSTGIKSFLTKPGSSALQPPPNLSSRKTLIKPQSNLSGRRMQFPLLMSQRKFVPVKGDGPPVRKPAKPPASQMPPSRESSFKGTGKPNIPTSQTQPMRAEPSGGSSRHPLPATGTDTAENFCNPETCRCCGGCSEKIRNLLRENEELRRRLGTAAPPGNCS